jgi:hypothetical protein
MKCLMYGPVAVLVLAGVCGGQPPRPPAADAPKLYTGKVVPPATPPGKPAAKSGARGLVLMADDGTTYPLVEDAGSRMLFLDDRLRNRPVRLTALPVPGTGKLRVVLVQTVKDGKVFDVDYWCGICQISLDYPGACVCCGDDTEFRERPAQEPEGRRRGTPGR